MGIYIQQSDTFSCPGKQHGSIDGDRAFTNTAFTGQDQEVVWRFPV